MQEETIKDQQGKILGYIATDSHWNKTVKNSHGKVICYYFAELNVTTNHRQQIIAEGDECLNWLWALS